MSALPSCVYTRPISAQRYLVVYTPHLSQRHLAVSTPDLCQRHIAVSTPDLSQRHLVVSTPDLSQRHLVVSTPDLSQRHLAVSTPDLSQRHLATTCVYVIGKVCLLKRYKKMDKKDDSKQIKSSQGDTYEVIKETEDGQFTISSPSSYHPVGGANTYTANELNAGIKTRHMSKSSSPVNNSLYSLADGDQETKVKESSVYQEDYETISHSPPIIQLQGGHSLLDGHQCWLVHVAPVEVGDTKTRTFHVPPTPARACESCPSPAQLPQTNTTSPPIRPWTSGRSHSVDLTAMSYDDVVDVRAARSPRQCCKTAVVVLNNERPFDFKPKFFSENMYSLQRPVESEGSSTDGGDEGEEHIYEAYSGDDTEEMVDDKNTPRKKVRVVTMKPLSVTKEDYDTCTLVELDTYSEP
ncbi:hypothetical protein Btru_042343 [Bulinus truncatus]|nr:hypothetical protein Btru_042343 [Bulinus truncatus]